MRRHAVSCESLETRLFLAATPNDPRYVQEWGLSAVNASAAWATTTGSAATVVADIDTGLDYTHDDLYQNVWINQSEIPTAIKNALKDTDGDKRISFYDLNAAPNRGVVKDVDKNGRIDGADLLTSTKSGGWEDGKDEGGNGYVDDIIGWDFADNDNDPLDYVGHGTHTAGTIGATGNNAAGVTGVDWRVSIMPVKIFDDNGDAASNASIAAAIRYSADNGARVSNNSWGGGSYSSAIYNAIAYAGTKGQLFVVAAGNDGANLDSTYYDDYPAEFALSNVLVVGASSSSGSAAYYSNYGASVVDVFAPGSNVLSTYLNDGYATMSGTSMATPHVAGAGALLHDLHPDWTPGQIHSALLTTASTAGLVAEDGVTPATPFDRGSGRVQLKKAMAPGVTFDVPVQDYVDHALDLWTVNHPSVFLPAVAPNAVTVTRTAKSVLAKESVWDLTVQAPPDLTVTVPTQLTLPAGGTADFSIGVNKSAVPAGQVRHATLTMKSKAYLATLPISVVGSRPLPDLVLTLVYVQSPLTAGGTVQAGVQLKNVGAATGGISHTYLYLSTDAVFSQDDILISYCGTTAPVASGATDVCGGTTDLNAAAIPGTYYAIATVDGDGEVAESDESNNVAVMPTTVVVN